MAPKHPRDQPASPESQHASKRSKPSPIFKQDGGSGGGLLSRSETPADQSNAGKVPFSIVYSPAAPGTLKKKLGKDKLSPDEDGGADLMESPFKARGARREGDLDQYYSVLPAKEWESMKKYTNFIIQGEVYKNDTVVYVRSETTRINPNEDNDHQFWIAKILQVRAKNAQNVFALVAWMYWPEELPGLKGRREPGAQEYHGKFELVASNYMEVLDVLSFAGKADVSQWLEEDDTISTRLYWRQTYSRQTQELSKIKEHCICNGHFNPDPDKQMYICDNDYCEIWLHKECLIHSALLNTYNRLIGESNGTAAAAASSSSTKKKASKKPYVGKFSGKLVDEESKISVEITDLRAGKKRKTWREPAACLKCGTKLLG